ncbi:MAG TPA: MauE/DoxX family redox-associated membrane protein [Bryobacteraceae bacterium]|nr:MauE/DoxX family redox-associated membrane protein [Bryobacteraceae bacterium]
MKHANLLRFAILYLRWSLGLTFLSACADRFGIWGPPGSKYAVWGDWAHFVAYSATLNWYLPASLQSPIAWIATIAEISLGFALIIGLYLRQTAYISAVVLALFALAMTFSVGIKAPLNSSVFVDAGAAWLLGCVVELRSGRNHGSH